MTADALPEPLARLVRAAVGGQLSRGAELRSDAPGVGGYVPNLGEYVLAWAATWAIGGDRAHAGARLEAARHAWGRA